MDYVNTGGINVVLTPGRYNLMTYYEHVFLAEATGAKLVFPNELEVIGDYLYYKNFKGEDVKLEQCIEEFQMSFWIRLLSGKILY